MRFVLLVLLAFTLAARAGASPRDTDSAGDSSPDWRFFGRDGGTGRHPRRVWTAILADLERHTGGPSDPAGRQRGGGDMEQRVARLPGGRSGVHAGAHRGLQVILEVDGERYDYRVGSGPDVKLCEGGPLEGGG